MERIKLIVTNVSEPKEIGVKGAKKLSFKAKTPDGKELSYFTFRPTLFDTIRVGAELDAEVEVKTREVDEYTYTDRQVNQLFIDGKSAGGQRQGFSRREDTPEQRASIEAQTAVKAGVELLVAGIIKPNEELGKLVIAWCISRLSESPKAKPEAKAKPEIITKLSEMPRGATESPPVASIEGMSSLTPTEELFLKVAEAKVWRDTKPVRSWLVNGPCKIKEERLDSEPEKVWAEIAPML